MTVQLADTRQRAFQAMLARDKVRLRDPQSGELLHLSGQGTTTDGTYSWIGYRHQADALRSRAETRGEQWPFRPVHRSLLDPISEVDE